MVEPYTVEKEINGKKYIGQFYNMEVAVNATDKCRLDGQAEAMSNAKLYQYLFDNVIVDPPSLTINDFDNLDELAEVVSFANDVASGLLKPKNKDNKSKLTKEK